MKIGILIPNTQNKVGCIKAVRMLGGIGLKEAKDLVEAAMGQHIGRPIEQPLAILPHLTDAQVREQIKILEDWGAAVTKAGSDTRSIILGTLKETALFATTTGEYTLASKINLLLSEAESENRVL